MWAPYVCRHAATRPPHNGDREDAPGQDIEHVVVGSCHDGETGDGRVRHGQATAEAVGRDEQDLKGDPGCPRDVQGRHGGVEVRRHGCRFHSDVGHDGRVDEAGARDQPWRCNGKHPEHQKCEGIDRDQRVARRTVGNRVTPVDPQENDEGHRQVHQLVVPARQQLPPVMLAQEMVHRRLDLDVQPGLRG